MLTGNGYFRAHEALLGEMHSALKEKSALVIGAGGLGCVALLYLSKCGLKCIGVCDGDNIDETNLQRQVLFNGNDIGKNKAKAAAEKLAAECKIIPYAFNASKENISALIKDYDVILDCTDSFDAKFMINGACFAERKALIFGNALQWQGMCTLIDAAKNTGCLRCIFDGKILQNSACSNEGVLNSLTGTIGSIQATEAIKYLTGKGAAGKLFVYDAERNTSKIINYGKNRNCKTCSAGRNSVVGDRNSTEITPEELKKAMENGSLLLVDVREPFERAQGAIKGDISIPLGKLAEKCKELGKNDFIVLYCAHGNRSMCAVQALKEKGFSSVKSLSGGYEAWLLSQQQ